MTREDTRPRRTQAERRASTRAALLASAVEQINTTGAAAATTQQIAANAGLTRGAVQHHFGTPEDLYLAVVARGWDEVVAAHESAPAADTPLHQRVAGWADAMQAAYYCDAARAAYELLVTRRNDATFMADQLPALKDAETVLDRMWCEAFADTDLSAADLVSTRRTARSFVLGTLVRRISDPTDTADPAQELTRLLAALLTPSR